MCLLCNSCVGSSLRSFASLLVPSLIRSHVRWSSRSFVDLLGYHSLSGLLYLLTRIFFYYIVRSESNCLFEGFISGLVNQFI